MAPGITALPLDVWLTVQRFMTQRDLVSLALTCRDMAQCVPAVLAHRGVHLKHGQERAALSAVPDVRSLVIRGLSRRVRRDIVYPPLRLPPLRLLERLTLEHPFYPPNESFWPGVLDSCPRLTNVSVMSDFVLNTYAAAVNHHTSLVRHGASRLERIDIRGDWLVFYPHCILGTPLADIQDAIRAMEVAPPVFSDRLTSYHVACRQTPITIDAPNLVTLEIDENPRRPSLMSRMGALTKEAVRHVKWKHHWPLLDPRDLAPYTRLHTLDLTILSATSAWRLNDSLATLVHLPPGVHHLTLRLDTRLLRGVDDDAIVWGRPLAHLHGLESLKVHMTFAPKTVEALLADWMGAPSPRSVTAHFDEPRARGFEEAVRELVEEEGACSEDETVTELNGLVVASSARVCDAGVRSWLDAHPDSVMTVRGLDRLRCSHPRFCCV